jgi:SAM-dependent methyltransferase
MMEYTIDEKKSGLERQKNLAQIFVPSTIRFLDEVGDIGGSRALDLGCGIGETTRLLGERVGPSGSVMGVDFDPGLIESAESLTSDGHISYTEGDVHALRFDDIGFDFVYARLLLLHVADPVAALREMIRVCRLQGTVMVHDGDFTGIYTTPNPAGGEGLNKLFSLFRNERIGIELWQLFRECGYERPEIRIDRMLVNQPSGKRLVQLTIEAMRGAVVQAGVMSGQEVDDLHSTISTGVQDDNYVIGFPEMYAAWV